MNKALLNRRLRKVHLWLGTVIGLQVGLWLISGLFMTWFPIETVRGEHLQAEHEPSSLVWSDYEVDLAGAIAKVDEPIERATAIVLNKEPIWQLTQEESTWLVHAKSGFVISPLADNWARDLAAASYIGGGEITTVALLTDPPQEYGRAGPVWRVDFGPTERASFYVDASTGEVRAVRTLLWRTFDFMWGLHIMDWSTRENFNSWWLKMTASLAVLFFLAGLGLVVLRWSGVNSRHP